MEEYDSIESRALKSGFLSRMALKTNSPAILMEDLCSLTGINSGPADDFPVEELLNLDFSLEGSFSQENEEEEERVSVSTISSQHRETNSSSSFSGTADFDEIPAGELSVPVDELESLEWLSQFVDDSTSGNSLSCTAGSLTEKARELPGAGAVLTAPVPCFPTTVLGKLRSKRSKRTWSLTSSSSNGSSTESFQDTDSFSSAENSPAKKQRKNPTAQTGSLTPTVRRCTHCQVQKTPQWRAGPLGPKTLCNACGVRYKSGRLLPEYRPACSPTFSQDIHSNSHRKVLEMRRKKEMPGLVEPGRTPMVPSF